MLAQKRRTQSVNKKSTVKTKRNTIYRRLS